MEDVWDLVVIGAGMGGSALAWSLRDTGKRILILERGEAFTPEAENWDPVAVIRDRRYDPSEEWLDGEGNSFVPRVYYTTGGSSKFFGGTAFRLREDDFAAREFNGSGRSEPWPLSYNDLRPWYDVAETMMGVRAGAGDPTEPPRGGVPYPYSPVEPEPDTAWLAAAMKRQGLRPFPVPIAVQQGGDGRCRKGSPCDGFPCRIRAKGDGENAFLRPALRESGGTITLRTGVCVHTLVHDDTGSRITAAEVEYFEGGRKSTGVVRGNLFVLAAGAVNSAALLLRSRSARHPAGLANGSGVLGRNFMAHNNTVLMAFSPFRRNRTSFQKTVALNDYYGADVGRLGNVQMRGKVQPQNLQRSPRFLVRLFSRYLAARTFDLWLMSEDLPVRENRVVVREEDGKIQLIRRLNNMEVHRELVRRMKKHLRRAGLPFILTREPSPSAIQHQVGTIRFGDDPARSVLDRDCRAWEVGNLFVVDGSVFPSSAAVNPVLTIAANALRVGAIIRGRLTEGTGEVELTDYP